MNRLPALALSGVALMILAGCGGGGNDGVAVGLPADTGRGSVVTQPPERVQRLTTDQFTSLLQVTAQGRSLQTIAGTPKCGVDLRYLEYRTIGGQGEATNATAAIMVPAGTDAACNGPRPVVLYAHGTTAAGWLVSVQRAML